MNEDARFEDAEAPVRLRAEEAVDLAVISALLQDAVGTTAETAWLPKRRRFTALLNRFRWEDAPAAERGGRPFERVRSLLSVENALRTRARGIDPRSREQVVAVLALTFEPTTDGAGLLRMILAGGGEIAVEVECLDVRLSDVTRPYLARADSAPQHQLD